MTRHWILLADASRARLFLGDELLNDLTELKALTHPASRLNTSDLVSDGLGRARSSSGHAALQPHSEPTDVEHEAFAREVAELLVAGHDTQAYEKLVIAAPPRFLGRLRAHLPRRVEDAVSLEIPKELTLTPAHDVSEVLHRYV